MRCVMKALRLHSANRQYRLTLQIGREEKCQNTYEMKNINILGQANTTLNQAWKYASVTLKANKIALGHLAVKALSTCRKETQALELIVLWWNWERYLWNLVTHSRLDQRTQCWRLSWRIITPGLVLTICLSSNLKPVNTKQLDLPTKGMDLYSIMECLVLVLTSLTSKIQSLLSKSSQRANLTINKDFWSNNKVINFQSVHKPTPLRKLRPRLRGLGSELARDSTTMCHIRLLRIGIRLWGTWTLKIPTTRIP